MKTKLHIRWHSSLLATLALVILMAAASFLVSGRVNEREEQASLDILYQEAETLALEMENQAASDREQLEMLATVAASFSDLRDPRLWEILDSYTTVGLMSDLSMLLPDGTVIVNGTEEVSADEMPPFEEIAAQGIHITGREWSPVYDGYVLRHFVPVVQDGETAAMLYGIVILETLPDKIVFSPYGGNAAIYLIDGETGEFLLDTWHRDTELGNIWGLGERPMAPGYTKEVFQSELTDGVRGHVIFQSRTTGNDLYFHYMPLHINQWRLALSVEDTFVFADANLIRSELNVFLLFEGFCFLAYFLWMLRYVHRETGEKQRQVDAINNVYDVAKLLFGAHEDQKSIGPALERIASSTGGIAASFWVSGVGENGMFFGWNASDSALTSGSEKTPAYIPALLKRFRSGGQYFEAHDPAEMAALLPHGLSKDTAGLAAIPLEDAQGAFCGILAVENPLRGQDIRATLRSVSFSFSMLCQNLQGYSTIRVQGETDTLTGLLNRNRYEKDLPGYADWYRESLACVYIDTNGLHELNNTQGHEAGDHMLRRTAAEISARFGKERSYRIGGDEFVVFAADLREEAVVRLCLELQSVLEAEDIHISFGIRWAAEIADLDAFIKAAEGEMYAAKRRYYAEQSRGRRQQSRLPAQ